MNFKHNLFRSVNVLKSEFPIKVVESDILDRMQHLHVGNMFRTKCHNAS